MTIDTLGGRKAAATLGVLVVGATITMIRGDLPPNMLQLLEVVFGGFVAGNGIEHLARAHKEIGLVKWAGDKAADEAPAPVAEAPAPVAPQPAMEAVDLTPVLAAIAQCQAAVEATHQPIMGTQQTVSALLQYVTGIKK